MQTPISPRSRSSAPSTDTWPGIRFRDWPLGTLASAVGALFKQGWPRSTTSRALSTSRRPSPGAQVAFILNVTDSAAAHDMLEKLPLGQAHLMSFELIPLAPLNPLRQLQGMSTGLP
jgi:hypothetical protein